MTRKAFLVKVKDEIAGFVLLDQVRTDSKTEKNMGEFFILAKFQNKKIGCQVAHQVWKLYPVQWEVSVIPENKRALIFWRKTISDFTQGNYKEEIKQIDYDVHQPNRIIFSFNTKV